MICYKRAISFAFFRSIYCTLPTHYFDRDRAENELSIAYWRNIPPFSKSREVAKTVKQDSITPETAIQLRNLYYLPGSDCLVPDHVPLELAPDQLPVTEVSVKVAVNVIGPQLESAPGPRKYPEEWEFQPTQSMYFEVLLKESCIAHMENRYQIGDRRTQYGTHCRKL